MQHTNLYPGQLVMVDIEGTSLDVSTAHFLREHHIRAVCLFRKNLGTAAEVRKLTADLREVMGPLALIGIDQEGGSVIRATFLPQAPAAMALGASGDLVQAQHVGAAVSRGLRSLGINWNFAPVVDVNNNPANPVIAERSFSADPVAVARLAGAWMEGAMSEGVACCIKHFPGHGDTHTDSHRALPTVDKSLAQLEELELVPFRALAGTAPAVMTAHIVYPQIDPEHPATLSRKLLTGVLRESIGYSGVVITDALMMKAVYDRYGHARASVLTLQAGADLVLAQGERAEQLAALQAIGAALDSGDLDHTAMRSARDSVDALARRFPLHTRPYGEAQQAQDDALMTTAWARGLTAVGQPVAPARAQPLRVIAQASVASDGVSEAGLPLEQVQALFSGFANVQYLPVATLHDLDVATLPRDGRCNVLVSNHHGRYGASSTAAGVDLHLAIWNPFQVMDIRAPAIVTWGYADGAMRALKAWLQGEAQATGTAPVALTHA
ncbi:beta-N-acetylhexosaminidase [Rhodoferax sp. AJA081-3]|uniref:beta-N-acetylhexosaminidase n=1 Tax=Rhodoferax sp. AJA081-3 TaxID=2752316 RepID=UPI001FD85D15|nr:beta-N-acetylhexosaminidase [Rhodoferax sp. AJA081-3]